MNGVGVFAKIRPTPSKMTWRRKEEKEKKTERIFFLHLRYASFQPLAHNKYCYVRRNGYISHMDDRLFLIFMRVICNPTWDHLRIEYLLLLPIRLRFINFQHLYSDVRFNVTISFSYGKRRWRSYNFRGDGDDYFILTTIPMKLSIYRQFCSIQFNELNLSSLIFFTVKFQHLL